MPLVTPSQALADQAANTGSASIGLIDIDLLFIGPHFAQWNFWTAIRGWSDGVQSRPASSAGYIGGIPR